MSKGGGCRLSPDGWRLAHSLCDVRRAQAIVRDSECYVLSQDIDLPVGPHLGIQSELEARGIPAHWLTSGMTWRDALSMIAGICLMSQRLEGKFGLGVDQWMTRDGLGWASRWKELNEAQQEMMHRVRSSIKRSKRFPISDTMQMREMVEGAATYWATKTLYVGGAMLQPDHSYGDRQAATWTDTFTGSIDSNWTNPAGPWNPNAVQYNNNAVRAPTGFQIGGMIWDGDSLDTNHWVEVDGDSHAGNAVIGLSVRSNTSNRAGYFGMADGGGTAWELRDYNSTGTITTSSSTTSNSPHAIGSGDTFTMEVEGDTVRIGSNDSGGGDTERWQDTFTSHDTAVLAGIGLYGAGTQNNARVTAARGGDMSPTATVASPLFRSRTVIKAM